MPLYSFESEDGEVIERLVPLGTKALNIKGKAYNRSAAPEGFAFTGNAVGMLSQSDQVREGYHKLEQEKGSRFLDSSNFTAKQIKKVWGF